MCFHISPQCPRVKRDTKPIADRTWSSSPAACEENGTLLSPQQVARNLKIVNRHVVSWSSLRHHANPISRSWATKLPKDDAVHSTEHPEREDASVQCATREKKYNQSTQQQTSGKGIRYTAPPNSAAFFPSSLLLALFPRLSCLLDTTPGRAMASVFLGDLDDFIAPGQACINPLFTTADDAKKAAAAPAPETSSGGRAAMVLELEDDGGPLDAMVRACQRRWAASSCRMESRSNFRPSAGQQWYCIGGEKHSNQSNRAAEAALPVRH